MNVLSIGIKSAIKSDDAISPFYSDYVPYTVLFDPTNKKLKDIYFIVTNDLLELNKRKSYKKDVYIRFPKLYEIPKFLNINFSFAKMKEDIVPQHGALTISLLENGDFIFIGSELKCTQTSFNKQIKFTAVHLDALLESVIKYPDKNFVDLSILAKQDTSVINKNFHGSSFDTPVKLIPELFEEQVKNNPNKPAVFYESSLLSYAEFNNQINKIARFLLKKGIKKGHIVAVSMDNTKILLCCMFALMKIGAIYLPLDPTYPKNQLSFVLQDAKVHLLITSSNLKDVFSWYKSDCIQIDKKWSAISKESSKNTTNHVEPADIAYIIYTSGSTGKPKGVLVSHANIANSTIARVQYYHKYNEKIELNFLPLLPTSFDTSMAGILWPLILGVKLTILPPNYIKNVNEIINTIEQEKITNIICVPAQYAQIISTATKEQLKTLRLIILGGDYWDLKLVKLHKNAVPNANLFNEYGVTEVTIWSTVKLIYDAKTQKYAEISIGWPIANTAVLLLDKYLQPVPIGLNGELFLSGKNVSQGYLNRKDLTKERFILYKNKSNEPIKLYKTGDVCCYVPNKGFFFRGRSDHQVKIRGVRIELPQIEKQLMQFPGLKQCVVVDKEVNSEKRIVAYLVFEGNNDIDSSEIKQFLVENLPSYMIPDFFVKLSYIPLTRNNKLERKLLPEPDINKDVRRNNYEKAKSETEKSLVKIWGDILNFKRIGVKDNFFDIGGHSLLVTEMLTKVCEKFKSLSNVDIQCFLENPTIFSLAKTIDGLHSEEESNKLDFINDTNLNASSYPSIPNNKIPLKPQSVFLTGVTGFLGIYLLYDLLLYTKANIYCLIRAKSYKDAKTRLKSCLNKNMLDLSILKSNRTKILVGDLALPKLGLSDKKFQHLTNEIDFIYHNGAMVHHLYDYNTLRAPNVLSIHEIIKIATTKKLKKIHYVSTFSTTVEFNDLGEIKENFLYESNVDPMLLQGGYARSKWVAERLLTQAKDKGIPVNIYRPTWILGHSHSGVSPTKQNHLLQVIKGCIQMGCAPNWDVGLNIIPVYFVSEAIVKFSLDRIDESLVFNLQNRTEINWKNLVTFINKNYCPIRILESNEWRDKHLSLINPDNMLYPLMSFYTQGFAEIPSFKINIEDKNVQKAMKEFSISFPSSNEDLLSKYFDYFQSVGFISV